MKSFLHSKTMLATACRALAPALILGSWFACGAVPAQTFPSRPVHLVVGFPPGGGSDVPSRILAAKLGDLLGQPFVVENRTGAGGYIGASYVAKAPADGYTLFACSIATHGTGPALYKKPPVDAEKDFAPVAMIGSNPNVLVVNPSVPVKTLPEFIAWAKAGAGKYAYGSPGPGTSAQLAMELLKQTAGFDLLPVTYKGDAPAQQDLIAGHVPVMMGGMGQHLGNIRGGMSRAIAVTSRKRNASLPDVPTFDESGLPGFEVLSWLGICAPAATPEPVLDTLNAAIVKVLNQPETRAQLVRGGWDPDPSSRKEFATYIHDDIARWRKVAREANISLD